MRKRMNVNQERMADIGYEQSLEVTEIAFVRTFGSYEPLFVTDTYQFEDYSKYEVTCFSGEEKAERKKKVFPEDCSNAFDMGARFAHKDYMNH